MHNHLAFLAVIFAVNVMLLLNQPDKVFGTPAALATPIASSPGVATSSLSRSAINTMDQCSGRHQIAVHFRQTGGIQQICRGLLIEPAVLPKSQDRELVQLVKQSGIMGVYSMRHIDPRKLAAYHYNVAILENGKITHDATFDDATLPASYRPLVKFLSQHSRPQNNIN